MTGRSPAGAAPRNEPSGSRAARYGPLAACPPAELRCRLNATSRSFVFRDRRASERHTCQRGRAGRFGRTSERERRVVPPWTPPGIATIAPLFSAARAWLTVCTGRPSTTIGSPVDAVVTEAVEPVVARCGTVRVGARGRHDRGDDQDRGSATNQPEAGRPRAEASAARRLGRSRQPCGPPRPWPPASSFEAGFAVNAR